MAITRFQSKEIQIFRNGILLIIVSHSLRVMGKKGQWNNPNKERRLRAQDKSIDQLEVRLR